MKQTLRSSFPLILALLNLIACSPSSEGLIRDQIEQISINDSTNVLVFEHIGTSSSATGNCVSTWLDRWYGSEESFATIEEAYRNALSEDSWEFWPEDVTRIWRFENEDGLFSFILIDMSDTLNPEREDYFLSATDVHLLEDYPTAYLLRLGYMTNTQARRCFDQ